MKKLISKNAKWCSMCDMLFCQFSGHQEALEEQKHKDEKINLIEKQVVERNPVGKHFIDLDDLILLSEIKKYREGKMLKVEKMMEGKIPASSMLLKFSISGTTSLFLVVVVVIVCCCLLFCNESTYPVVYLHISRRSFMQKSNKDL
jgi:hypothetical protein